MAGRPSNVEASTPMCLESGMGTDFTHHTKPEFAVYLATHFRNQLFSLDDDAYMDSFEKYEGYEVDLLESFVRSVTNETKRIEPRPFDVGDLSHITTQQVCEDLGLETPDDKAGEIDGSLQKACGAALILYPIAARIMLCLEVKAVTYRPRKASSSGSSVSLFASTPSRAGGEGAGGANVETAAASAAAAGISAHARASFAAGPRVSPSVIKVDEGSHEGSTPRDDAVTAPVSPSGRCNGCCVQ